VFVIRDASGEGIRKLYQKAEKGVNRVQWDLRLSSTQALTAVEKEESVPGSASGLLAMPGAYSVELYQVVRGEVSQLTGPVPFNAVLLNQFSLPVKDREALRAFQAYRNSHG
jgi:hypothetical protein